jgi:hypothetical protein
LQPFKIPRFDRQPQNCSDYLGRILENPESIPEQRQLSHHKTISLLEISRKGSPDNRCGHAVTIAAEDHVSADMNHQSMPITNIDSILDNYFSVSSLGDGDPETSRILIRQRR